VKFDGIWEVKGDNAAEWFVSQRTQPAGNATPRALRRTNLVTEATRLLCRAAAGAFPARPPRPVPTAPAR
jgi:hypothetical protein